MATLLHGYIVFCIFVTWFEGVTHPRVVQDVFNHLQSTVTMHPYNQGEREFKGLKLHHVC